MRKSSLTLLGLLLIVLLAMAPVMAASAQITDVKVTDVKTALKVVVTSDTQVKYRTMRMNKPKMALVLEVFPAKIASNLPKIIQVNQGLVEQVRIAQFSERPDIVRIVLDLISPAEFNVVTSPDKKTLNLVMNTLKIADNQKTIKTETKPVTEVAKPAKPVVQSTTKSVAQETAKPAKLVVKKETTNMQEVAKPAKSVEKVEAKPVEKPVLVKPEVTKLETPTAKPVVEIKTEKKPIALKMTEVSKKSKPKVSIRREPQKKTISLDFEGADLLYVIKLLAKEIGINMVTDQTVKGEVTMSLRNVTPEAALNLILKMSGFESKRVNNTIIVGSKDTIDKIPNDIMKKGIEKTVTQKIYLNNADPQALAARLSDAYPNAVIKPMGAIRGLEVTAPVNQIIEIKQAASQYDIAQKSVAGGTIEKPREQTDFVQLKFNKAKEMLESLKSLNLIPATNFTAIADENTNMLIFKGSEDAIRQIKDYISKIELSKIRQIVRLDVKVVDLTELGSKELGMTWSGGTQAGGMGSMGSLTWSEHRNGAIETDPLSTTTTFVNDIGIGYFSRSPITLYSTIVFLVSKGDARVVASPTVSTISGKEAVVKVGETYPYVFQDPRSGQYQVQNIEYLTRLTITPTITSEDYSITEPDKVLLDADIEVNDQKGTETTLKIPIKGTKAVKTQVVVRSGETLVIGGLMSVDDEYSVAKIPLLGDIPLIGIFFQDKKIVKSTREVVIMITPTILREGVSE